MAIEVWILIATPDVVLQVLLPLCPGLILHVDWSLGMLQVRISTIDPDC